MNRASNDSCLLRKRVVNEAVLYTRRYPFDTGVFRVEMASDVMAPELPDLDGSGVGRKRDDTMVLLKITAVVTALLKDAEESAALEEPAF